MIRVAAVAITTFNMVGFSSMSFATFHWPSSTNLQFCGVLYWTPEGLGNTLGRGMSQGRVGAGGADGFPVKGLVLGCSISALGLAEMGLADWRTPESKLAFGTSSAAEYE